MWFIHLNDLLYAVQLSNTQFCWFIYSGDVDEIKLFFSPQYKFNLLCVTAEEKDIF